VATLNRLCILQAPDKHLIVAIAFADIAGVASENKIFKLAAAAFAKRGFMVNRSYPLSPSTPIFNRIGFMRVGTNKRDKAVVAMPSTIAFRQLIPKVTNKTVLSLFASNCLLNWSALTVWTHGLVLVFAFGRMFGFPRFMAHVSY
jgi:hypothetical protein